MLPGAYIYFEHLIFLLSLKMGIMTKEGAQQLLTVKCPQVSKRPVCLCLSASKPLKLCVGQRCSRMGLGN